MVWNPSDLRLDSIEPATAPQGKRLELTVNGAGFEEGIQLILLDAKDAAANRVMPGYGTAVTEGNYKLVTNITTQNVEPGTYTVLAWNPLAKGNTGNDVVPLENAFTITAAQ